MKKHEQVAAELKRLAAENGGVLLPEKVVAAARSKKSPLHSKFTWDDTKAAHEYRIWQARQLIKVVVETTPGLGRHEVFVSLTPDRKKSGYRVLTQVLSSEQMREQLLADALRELQLFQEKYAQLKELAAVFAAAITVRKRHHPRAAARMAA